MYIFYIGIRSIRIIFTLDIEINHTDSIIYKNKLQKFNELTKNQKKKKKEGDIAQMVERSLSMREVSGSIPDISINFYGYMNKILYLTRFFNNKYIFYFIYNSN